MGIRRRRGGAGCGEEMWMEGGDVWAAGGGGDAFRASRWQSVSPSTVDCKLQHLSTTTLPFVQMYSMKLHSGENKGGI